MVLLLCGLIWAMPGLTWRAVGLRRPRREMWGGAVGWSVVITSAVFGLAHGLQVQPEGIAFEPGYTIVTAALGFAFAWLRIRWDSLLPAVLAHNAWNVSFVLAPVVSG